MKLINENQIKENNTMKTILFTTTVENQTINLVQIETSPVSYKFMIEVDDGDTYIFDSYNDAGQFFNKLVVELSK